ncbi:hypothetical protein SAMN04488033_10415 [Salegentibacter agarivorans]|uniref:Cytochrome P450 n=1 Tax=Salegentibacter agarivorans TaxID=345907 RepID=A0A1I2KM56_9FLAO|nr:cytochrome P450 [Salegentibacter agarivorans]SFF67603.1 hypothetical protein SAMN04488033_10415 [Salegentibacter agarivorans]
MKKSTFPDPFKSSRANNGTGEINDQNDPALMLFRHKDVRKCAHNWKTFQSGAKPGRIVIPSEVNIRDVRQIPFEVDPPEHKSYRELVEPWFKRPLKDSYQKALRKQINIIIENAIHTNTVDIVSELALILQSRALTLLLNVPFEESKTWISWGTHVFRSEETALDASKANILYDYIDEQIEKSIENPGEDLYSVLLNAEIDGQKLSKEEVKGVMVLTFAGGRDTVINAVTNTIAYFAEHPESLDRLRKSPNLLKFTIEELIRYFSPLTQMGRVSTEDTKVCEHAVKKNERISLVWAAANRDPSVFEDPNNVILDRKINPHVAFGFGVHNCLGATHARQIIKMLVETLMEKVENIEILDAKENIEDLGDFKRKVGFEKINVKFNSK